MKMTMEMRVTTMNRNSQYHIIKIHVKLLVKLQQHDTVDLLIMHVVTVHKCHTA